MTDSELRLNRPPDDLDANPVDARASRATWDAFVKGASTLGGTIAAPSPQILEGEAIITPGAPGGGASVPDPDTVRTWWQPSGVLNSPATWNEVWDVAEPQDLDLGFQVHATAPLVPHFDPVAFLTQPPANGKWRAHMRFQYLSPPPPGQPGGLPAVPQGARHLRFDVKVAEAQVPGGPPPPPPVLAGSLYRVRHGMSAIDFWALWDNYLGPEIGIRTLVVEPSGAPAGGPNDLQDYLGTIPPHALFVSVPYTWQS